MKKLFLLSLTALLTSSSYALTWNFTTASVDEPPLKFLSGTNGNAVYTSTSTSGGGNGPTQFNILGAGYNPASMVVTAATVTFWFADDANDGGEQVDIYVNGTSVTGTRIFQNLEVDGSHPDINFAAYSANLQDFAGLIAGIQDGIMEYQVRLLNGANGGDTYLKVAGISATGSLKQVPDSGASVALFGLALLALGALRKRF